MPPRFWSSSKTRVSCAYPGGRRARRRPDDAGFLLADPSLSWSHNSATDVAIVYFDSSALVKLVVDEDASDVAAALWDGADAVVSSGLAYPEVRAALAAAHRDERISARSMRKAKEEWEQFWEALAIVESRRSVLVDAGEVAERYRLRGYDAVHLASALTIPNPHILMAGWDERLRSAAVEAGLSIAPIQL